jgi:hypothetical protein
MRFEVFTAVKIQVEFWVVTKCSVEVGYQRFGNLATSILRASQMQKTPTQRVAISYTLGLPVVSFSFIMMF